MDGSQTFKSHCLTALSSILTLKLRELLSTISERMNASVSVKNSDKDIDDNFYMKDLGMDLGQLSEKVFHIAEIHIVSLGTNGSAGSMEDSSQLLVTLQRLLAVAGPLLLYSQNRNINSLSFNAASASASTPASQSLQSSSAEIRKSTTHNTSQDAASFYPRFLRMWSVISKSTDHPWGSRETVRYTVLTSYFQIDLDEIRSSLQLFKKVNTTISTIKGIAW